MWTPLLWYGGAKAVVLSADYQVVDRRVRCWSVAPSADNWKFKLPVATYFDKGADLFFIASEHATRIVLVCNSAGTTIGTLTGKQCVSCHLEDNSTAAGVWRTRVLPYNV